MNEFSKVAGYKIIIKKYVGFLYADNKLEKREFKGKNPIYNCIKKNNTNKQI